jgi:hypothetical protein
MWGCPVRLHHCTHGENQGPSLAGDEVENTMTRESGTKSIVDPETPCEADLSKRANKGVKAAIKRARKLAGK